MATTIAVYNLVVLPDSRLYLAQDQFKMTGGRQPGVGERLIFIIMKKAVRRESFTQSSFYPLGVSGNIIEVNNGFIVVQTESRVSLEDVVFEGNHAPVVTGIIRYPETEDLDPIEEKERVDKMKAQVMASSMQWAGAVRNFVSQWRTSGDIITGISQFVNLSPEEKYNLLKEDSKAKRLEMIEKAVYEYTALASVTNEAQNAQKEDNQKLYREAALRKQIEYLQKQLDEMHPENVTDVRKMEMKLSESGMNETARKEADKVLNRMKQEGNNSPEYGNLYNYLDFMTSLCWKKADPEKIDIKEAQRILDEDHYGLKKVKSRILQQIAVMDLNKKQSGSILLFVGAPGTGKTSIGKSIARALNRKYVRVSLGGVRDEADIRGHRRTYIGAMPGRIMDGIQKSGASNPVVVLDEVDKLGVSYNGDPASALLEVLDPEQNNTFTDHYMNVPYDLSDVFFICTANTLDSIPEPLLNRMEVIEFTGYTASEKYQIAVQHLLPRAMKSAGLKDGQLNVPEETIRHIISDYTAEGGVRGLRKRLDTLARHAAVDIASGDAQSVTVTEDMLDDYLDAKPVRHEHVTEEKKPGVVTGLAWTQAGGEILFIETLLSKGKGTVRVTGQLGDVMKESSEIALSVVRNRFEEQAKVLDDHDLHIHVPAGAVKKDGPSAGITMTTAIASLITGRPVDPTIAMTGEISLRGAVMPIGGLPEKLMAASRSGVKTVLIPKDNEQDLKDIADEVKEKLQIIPVSDIEDVWKLTGITEG